MVASDADSITVREAADLLGVDENTIRNRAGAGTYRRVQGNARPARIYAREVRAERADLLRRLKAREVAADAGEFEVPAETGRTLQELIDEVARLQAELAAATDVARVLLVSDTSKNELLRQYLYENKGW